MRKIQSISTIVKFAFFDLLLLAVCHHSLATDPPFIVKNGLFDQTEPDSLGLTEAEGTETISIFQPIDTTDHYSNGVVMTQFKDYMYCQWQSSPQNEDSQDTWVAYSRSQDGRNWTPPMILAESIDNGFCSSGGWWIAGDTLVAYINVWPQSVSPRGGYTAYTTSTDGLTWSALKPLPMANGDTLKGIFEQDPHALPDGRIINAAHFQPGLVVCPIYTDDSSGMRGWTQAEYTNLAISGGLSREIEPSWFSCDDDTLVMIFRDQNETFKKLASVSGDRGESWTTPVITGMPDSKAKQSAGNIADSTAFMASNPVNNKTRIPLVITLSRNGRFFNTAYVLRKGGDGIQALRYTGDSKRLGYHYPKSMIWKDTLYVSYATNKEDVEYTRVPINSLVLDTSTVNPPVVNTLPLSSENKEIDIVVNPNRIIKISLKDNHTNGIVSIYTLKGQIFYSSIIINGELHYDMKQLATGTYIINVRTDTGSKTQLINNW